MGFGFDIDYVESLDLLQFNVLMQSINRTEVNQRISEIMDSRAAQATSDDCEKYIKSLRKSVNMRDPNAGNLKDFLREVGSM